MNSNDITNGLSALFELYASRKQNQDLNTNYNTLAGNQQNQIQNLMDLYSPNSAYAQTMRQTLDRRDAAAGRRSQYGPREVELMAKLAGNQAQSQQSILNNMYSPQAMELARRQAATNPNNASMNALAYLNQARNLAGMFQKLNSNPDLSFNKFKWRMNNGDVIDDTYDPNLNFSSYDSYIPETSIADYYSGIDYGSGLDVGDVYNYGDYSSAVDFGSGYDWGNSAYDWGSSGYDWGSSASDVGSSASDLADWWG